MAKKQEYAGFWERFAAYLIDGLVLGAIFFALMMVFAFWAIASRSSAPIIVGVVIIIIGDMLYYCLLEGLKGQTLGKMALGIIVVGDADGKLIGVGRAFIRWLLALVDGFFFYLIGAVLILASVKKQRLGDMAAGSVVVMAPKGKGASISG